jgi:hypothetical protein
MPKVKSSHLKHVEYNPVKRSTVITFKDGSKHEYHNVPVSEYQRLIDADSVGSHFHAEFKDNYHSKKL